MKKLFYLIALIIVFIVACCPNAKSQTTTTDEKISVNKSELTAEQLEKIKNQKELEQYDVLIQKYGKFAGMGKEIGVSVRESLNAVVDVSDKFSKTDVGKFTMIMVAWKLMGTDIIRIFLGIIFMVVFNIFLFNAYKKNFTTHKIVIADNGWKFWLPKTYQIVKPIDYDGVEFVKFLYVVVVAGSFGLTYAIMFA